MSKDTQQLALQPQAPLAVAPSIPQILSAAVQGGITRENVEVVKELIAMQKDLQEQESKRDFARDFVALQSECKAVKASKIVPNDDGSKRYAYAPYEAIMEEVKPLLEKHNFAISFDTDLADGRVIVTCKLMHGGGHTVPSKFACRIGKGPPKSSEAQGDGAATTYAKRFALCAALNIVVDTDTDAQDATVIGEFVTLEQAEFLQAEVRGTKAHEPNFLKWLGAASYDQIPADRYEEAAAQLKKRRSMMPMDKDAEF